MTKNVLGDMTSWSNNVSVWFYTGSPDVYSTDGVSFHVNSDAAVVPAKFAPGDWTLAGNVEKLGEKYTFSGVNPAEEFGTFSISCTPPPPSPMQQEVDDVTG